MAEEKEYLKEIGFGQKLDEFCKNAGSKTVLIYGAGKMFNAIVQNYDLSKLNIIGISDRRFENENDSGQFMGFNICLPQEIKKLKPDYIIVSLKNYSKVWADLQYENEESCVLSMLTFQGLPYEDLKNLYLKTKRQFEYLKNHTDISTLKPASGELRSFQHRQSDFAYEMAEKFEQISCKAFLTAGNLLGAIRHKGFIPWDDDMDMALLRKDFEIVDEYCQNTFINIDTSRIDIRNPGFMTDLCAQIEKFIDKYPNEILCLKWWEHTQLYKGTTFYNRTNLDLFPYDYYAENYGMDEHRKYLENIYNQVKSIGCLPEILEFLKEERKNNPNIVEHSSKLYYGIDSSDSWIRKHTEFFPEKDILPFKKIKFENYHFYAPYKPEMSAKIIFKDYMKIPDDIGIPQHIKTRKQYLEQKKG